MHSYTVEFRICGVKENLDLASITEDLGIAPTNTRERNQAKGPSVTFAEAMWGYEVIPGKEWEVLGDALESILKVLMPLKSKIMRYNSNYDVILWCGHFTSSFDGGPTLSAEILQELGNLGIALHLDTYYSADE